jgi:hypothetical protein
MYYDLDGNKITFEEYMEIRKDISKWVINKTTVGESKVSTVWLGLNHSFDDGPPLIFETMVFGGPDNDWQKRYSTKEEALACHIIIVKQLESGGRLA